MRFDNWILIAFAKVDDVEEDRPRSVSPLRQTRRAEELGGIFCVSLSPAVLPISQYQGLDFRDGNPSVIAVATTTSPLARRNAPPEDANVEACDTIHTLVNDSPVAYRTRLVPQDRRELIQIRKSIL